MGCSPDSTCVGEECGGRNLLARSETADMRRLAVLVGSVFRVPVAYAAMLGRRDRVMNRIGSGEQYWKYLKTYPLPLYLASPVLLRDIQGVRERLPQGTDLGDLGFLAAVPMRTFCGQALGVLVIADTTPRPEFAESDLDTLVELAAVLAARMELSMIASQSVESALDSAEAEERFRCAADAVPKLIACNGADGSCQFVNAAWLEFTGRHRSDEFGDGWQQAIHPRHRERVLSLYWEALRVHRPFVTEVPMRRHDGVFRCMRGEGSLRLRQDGSSAGIVVTLTELSAYCEEVG